MFIAIHSTEFSSYRLTSFVAMLRMRSSNGGTIFKVTQALLLVQMS